MFKILRVWIYVLSSGYCYGYRWNDYRCLRKGQVNISWIFLWWIFSVIYWGHESFLSIIGLCFSELAQSWELAEGFWFSVSKTDLRNQLFQLFTPLVYNYLGKCETSSTIGLSTHFNKAVVTTSLNLTFGRSLVSLCCQWLVFVLHALWAVLNIVYLHFRMLPSPDFILVHWAPLLSLPC